MGTSNNTKFNTNNAVFGNLQDISGGVNLLVSGKSHQVEGGLNNMVMGSDNIVTDCSDVIISGSTHTVSGSKQSFINGKQNGKWYFYDNNAKHLKTEVFDEGKLIETINK